jgi:hypothetical protein
VSPNPAFLPESSLQGKAQSNPFVLGLPSTSIFRPGTSLEIKSHSAERSLATEPASAGPPTPTSPTGLILTVLQGVPAGGPTANPPEQGAPVNCSLLPRNLFSTGAFVSEADPAQSGAVKSSIGSNVGHFREENLHSSSLTSTFQALKLSDDGFPLSCLRCEENADWASNTGKVFTWTAEEYCLNCKSKV